jgi:hypothetical protein
MPGAPEGNSVAELVKMAGMKSIIRTLATAGLCTGLTLLTLPVHGAPAAPLQVRSLTMKPPAAAKDLPAYASGWFENTVKMPFVVSDPPAVGARITASLFVGVMGMAPPAKPGESFSPLPDQLPEGTASQEFQLTRNDERVLTIMFSIEGCGAYCENHDQTYNFDARNGRRLAREDLFTPASQPVIAARIGKARERQYADQLKTLKKELATQQKAQAKPDIIEDLKQRIELNQRCLESEKGQPDAADSLAYADFSLEGEGVTFTTGRCSSHAERALDDVGDIVVRFTPADLRPWLTPYGRALLLKQGDTAAPASPFGQILHGQIGGAAVTVMLDRVNNDGSVTGRYFYDKYGRLIALSGKRSGNTLELTEGSTEDDKAQLTLTVRGNALTGQWQGKGKTVPMALDW